MAKTQIGDNYLTALKTVAIKETGLNKKNCKEIFTERPFKSYMPGRDIQQFTEFEEGKTYLVKLIKPVDVSEYLTNGEV